MNCPKCGGEMEHGFLQMGGTVGFGLIWIDRLFERGEQFKAKHRLLMKGFPPPRNIEGFRCLECEIVVFGYGEKGKKVAEKLKEIERIVEE